MHQLYLLAYGVAGIDEDAVTIPLAVTQSCVGSSILGYAQA